MRKKKKNQEYIDVQSEDYVGQYARPADFNYSGYGSVEYDDSFLDDPETALNQQQEMNEEIYHKITGKLFRKQNQVSKNYNDSIDDGFDDLVHRTPTFNSVMSTHLEDEEDKIDSYKNTYQDSSFSTSAISNAINFLNQILTDEENEETSVDDLEQTQEFDEYTHLLTQLHISKNTLTAILQEITRQDSADFSYVKKNLDGSVLFFKDENNHIFSVPFENILEYTKILNG